MTGPHPSLPAQRRPLKLIVPRPPESSRLLGPGGRGTILLWKHDTQRPRDRGPSWQTSPPTRPHSPPCGQEKGGSTPVPQADSGGFPWFPGTIFLPGLTTINRRCTRRITVKKSVISFRNDPACQRIPANLAEVLRVSNFADHSDSAACTKSAGRASSPPITPVVEAGFSGADWTTGGLPTPRTRPWDRSDPAPDARGNRSSSAHVVLCASSIDSSWTRHGRLVTWTWPSQADHRGVCRLC